MNCRHCGAPIELTDRFCSNCGASVQQENKTHQVNVEHLQPQDTSYTNSADTSHSSISLLNKWWWVILAALAIGGYWFYQSNQKIKLIDYVEVEVVGLDSRGQASVSIDYDRLYDVYVKSGQKKYKDQYELDDALNEKVDININPVFNLSNEDNLTVTVTSKLSEFKGGKKKLTVKNLQKPKVLKLEDVFKTVVVSFEGANRYGKAIIENNLPDGLDTLNFEVKNNGHLSNSEKTQLLLPESELQTLEDLGYVLDKNFNVYVNVEGLANVVDYAKDITNYEDIQRRISEEILRTHKDIDATKMYGTRYELKREATIYRPAADRSDQYGTLLDIYTVKEYNGGTDGRLRRTFTDVIGFHNILVDESNKADLSQMKPLTLFTNLSETKDSIIQNLKSDGYELVE
ncbi:zinc-ribbon domain-containing protein [Atopobacter phocae]|uniref:zinc-ribbon domain-containing protein n=1 Tax=Atopobacter phocae TaxID=136492 RepID=UPI00047196A4|nr:zinc ribbon domain-containing protein [Atopobacter phocae]